MNIDLVIGILNIVLISTTPLVFAGIGELVTEKSGVLNLGLVRLNVSWCCNRFYYFSFNG